MNALSSREVLLKRLQICSFVLTETQLFLDTHPTDKEALEHYNKYAAMYKETLDEYNEKYGPVNLPAMNMQSWKWIDDPWPWDMMEG